MSNWCGGFTMPAVGTAKSFIVGFQPTYLRITVSGKDGTTETVVHMSTGFTDGTRQKCHTIYHDGTYDRTIHSATGKIVSLFENVSGTLTEVLAASFNSFYASGFKLDVTATNSNYTLDVEAWA